MSFVKNCVEDSLPIWQKCLETRFLQALGAGTLEEDCFLGYIVDDSLYLREYAKVFAWGMTRAADMETLRVYYSFLSFVNEEEGATRLHYLRHYGLTDEAIQPLPLRPENRAYTQHMIRAAKEGGAAECMMAVLPCMLSYAWIFRRLLQDYPGVLDTVYGDLVRDYAGDGYDDACREWVDFADKVCAPLSPEEKERCMAIFRQSSLDELNFWRMSEQPRKDLK